MNDEEKKSAIEVWKRVISTQEHFNQMTLQVRNHLLTLVTALIGAGALVLQKEIAIVLFGQSISLAALLFGAGAIIVLAFYVTEKGYYHLLLGAVRHGERIETSLESELPGIGLTHSISAASHERILFGSMRSIYRLRVFYSVLFAMFLAAAVVAARGASAITERKTPVAAQTSASVQPWLRSATPNDPAAGTRALKKFYQTGAYATLLNQVAMLAESYVEQHRASIDRGKAVAVFDIDETALSTWEILESGEFTWDGERFRQFVLAGRGKKIEPVFRLYQKLRAAGIPIVFLTSRSEALREATEKNLQAEGFTGYAEIIMRPIEGNVSTKALKDGARQKLRAAGKVLFLSIGDQPDDLAAMNAPGNFLLPNPFY